MKKMLLPAAGITIVTIILLVINEFTDFTFVRDYAFAFIIAGMLLGVWLTRLAEKSSAQT